MAKSRTGHDRFPKSDKKTPDALEVSLRNKAHTDSMFCPRYVSEWCMSRRKRCFDFVLSLIALVLFSPLMLVIAWLIKLTSQGPALFRQERVGLHQQTFVIFKFRTLRPFEERTDGNAAPRFEDDEGWPPASKTEVG